MRRWNGWGDDTIEYAMQPAAEVLIQGCVGPGTPPVDAAFGDVVACVPPARLPAHPLISFNAEERVRHARGQSLADLIALRTLYGLAFPDGVASPTSDEDIRALIGYAKGTGTHLIPYGGGTSVVGHINVLQNSAPTLTVDMGRFSRLRYLDRTNQMATFEAGISGAYLEAQLRAHGYTLGHFPQSFEYSTLGGWIATRSKGQQSLHYGGIEKLFAGGCIETPEGRLDLPPFVSAAAGPDLRELVLGSEGRLGIITAATVRISPLPEFERFEAAFFPDFEHGVAAVREISQARLPLSMVRLSDPLETETTLALASHPQRIHWLEWMLRRQGLDQGKCMLLLGATGGALAHSALQLAFSIVRRCQGVSTAGERIGREWRKSRFRNPYLRDYMWSKGYAVDTIETATEWSKVMPTREKIQAALHAALQEVDERVFCFTHLSHVYPSGSSLYTTFVYRLAAHPDEMLRRAQALKTAASRVIVEAGAPISHQHGVGTDHLPYLAFEKQTLGGQALQGICTQFDPQGLMNPGKLVQAIGEAKHVE